MARNYLPNASSERQRRNSSSDEVVRAPCRICGQTIALQLKRTELVDNRLTHQCPFCKRWSTIRATDLARLVESQSVIVNEAD